MLNFYGLSQGKHRNNQEYYDKLNSIVLTAEESGATIGAHPGGIQEALNIDAIDANNPSDVEQTTATKTATDRYLAVAFLLGADKLRYGTLVEEIENEYLRNKGTHPPQVHTQPRWQKHTITYATTRRTQRRTSRDFSVRTQAVT
jgi:hypothetical protein